MHSLQGDISSGSRRSACATDPKATAHRFAMPHRKAWRFVPVTIIGLALAGCGKEEKQAGRPPPAVSTIVIDSTDVPVSMEFIAQTQSSQQVQIYARVTGFLDQRMYTEGT